MPVEYYAENHDWDMTLRAAWYLAAVGPVKNTKSEHAFSCFTGSMLLSFCAIESFINSIAFVMSRDERYKTFDYEKFEKSRGFWTRLKLVFASLAIEFESESPLMQTIEKMRAWRVSLVHSSPYAVGTTQIEQTNQAYVLHDPFRAKEYIGLVTHKNAELFYRAAIDIIELIKKYSGLHPRAMAQYKIL